MEAASETNSVATPVSRWKIIVGWGLSCLILVPFVPSALMKIVQPADFLAAWTKSFPAGAAAPLGVIELTNVVLYFVPRTRILGLTLVTAYLGGAVSFHVHARDGMFFAPVLVGVVAWIGLWLRDAKLRALFPLAND